MATKLPTKPRRTLLQEASDPSTDPERLRELAEHKNKAVQRVAIRNPSVPENLWRTALLIGEPEAWDNPMAPLYLLAWTPRENDLRTVDVSARLVVYALWETPERCSPEGKALLAAKVQEWWDTFESASDMMGFLGRWAVTKGKDSAEHREVVRILILCVRTVPNLTTEDRQALDLLEAWTAGGEDRRYEAEDLADLMAVKDACRFSLAPWSNAWNALFEVLVVVVSDKKGAERRKAQAEHQRQMADVIRQAMPLPPGGA